MCYKKINKTWRERGSLLSVHQDFLGELSELECAAVASVKWIQDCCPKKKSKSHEINCVLIDGEFIVPPVTSSVAPTSYGKVIAIIPERVTQFQPGIGGTC